MRSGSNTTDTPQQQPTPEGDPDFLLRDTQDGGVCGFL